MRKYLIRGKQSGFTLAEVLITLGIIGVVAAITLPTLIQKNNNRVVETRLKKFYSSINQAILMAENDYGDKTIWYADVRGAQLDENGVPIAGSSEAEKWFRKYLAPYMKIVKIDTLSDGALIVYFEDGSALQAVTQYSRDWYFYPGNPQKCLKQYSNRIISSRGVCSFNFIFCPTGTGTVWRYHTNKGMEPYKYSWDGNNSSLYNNTVHGCKAQNNSDRLYCTAIIQDNGWKIPDDYPYKVSY